MKIGESGKHILTLGAGTLVAQLIPVLASVVLARIYSADAYGDWGIFLSVVSLLAVAATGQYELAIVRPESEKDAEMVMRLCFLIVLSFFFLSFGGVLVGEVFHLPLITQLPGKYLLPFFVLALGLLQIYTHYANRKERYKLIAISGVVRNALQAISRISLGLFHCLYGLITGAFVGLLAAVSYCEYKMPLRRILFSGYDWQSLKRVAYRYRYFPIYQMPGSLLNAASTSVMVLMLALYFEKEYIGYFSMTISLLYFPVQLAGAAMSKVFYKKASLASSENQSHQLLMQLLRFTFAAGLLMTILLVGIGEELFSFVLGNRWLVSAQYAVILAPCIWIMLCFSPLSVIFDAKDCQRIELILNLVMFAVRVVAIVICGELHASMGTAIFCFGVIGLLVWTVEAYWIMKLSGARFTVRQLSIALPLIFLLLAGWIWKIKEVVYV